MGWNGKRREVKPPNISRYATVAPSAKISNNVTIEAGAVIGEFVVILVGARIGIDAVIETGAKIGVSAQVRERAVVRSGTVLGTKSTVWSDVVTVPGSHIPDHQGLYYTPEGAAGAPDWSGW
jgi:UDP-3-O-[3-hydroxymyristoyl] glucosamine N-acyltransferase